MKKKTYSLYLYFIALLLLEIFLFRIKIYENVFMGDVGDGLFNNLLAEHWYQVFLGTEAWNDLPIFHPLKNVISYSDMGLGFSFPYVLLRFLGINMYVSNKITLIYVHVLGTLVLFYVFYRKMKLSGGWALVGAVTFSFSGAYLTLFSHTQMLAVSFMPLLILMVWLYFEHLKDQKRYLYMTLAVLLLALLFYTAFYVAYFLAVYCLIFCVVFLLFDGVWGAKRPYKERKLPLVWEFMKGRWKDVVGFAGLFLLLLVPFFWSYLQSMKMFGERTWDTPLAYMPTAKQIIDMSPGTLLYGKMLQRIGYAGNPSVEGAINFSPVTLFLFIGVFILYCRKVRKDRWERRLMTVLMVSIVCSVVLIIKFDRFSLWYLFFEMVPGASAIRALARFYQFLHLPLAFLVAYCGNKICNSCKKQIWVYVILVLLFLGNFKTDTLSACYRIEDEIAKVQSIPTPPGDCENFYMYSETEYSYMDKVHTHLLAWTFAYEHDLKTLNGYSGNFPPGWWGMWNFWKVEALETANAWIEQYDLEHVYFYEMDSGRWIKVD